MRVFWISAVVVLLDQATKAAILQFMRPEQSIPLLGDWLRLTFTENPGMAFGITIGPPGTVTVLSLIATALVVAYIYQIRNDYAPYRWSLAFILGGALGNVIDRVFYGVLLGYGQPFTGRVVDFIHVSLWQGFIPQSVPFIGGSYLELFPIWNVADMSIVLGVVGVLLFHHSFHARRQARRKGARQNVSRTQKTRERPASVFVDLGRDVGTPPKVPSALARSDLPKNTNGTVSEESASSNTAHPTAMQEERS